MMCLEYDAGARFVNEMRREDRKLDEEHIEALRGALQEITRSGSLDNIKSIAKTALDFEALNQMHKRNPHWFDR